MMLQSCSTRRRSDRAEDGAVLVMMAFLLAALLAVSGLAIDAGNLFRARLALQKAVDSGALGGIAATIHLNDVVQGMSAAEQRTFIEARARQIAHENLLSDGLTVDPDINILPDYFPAAAGDGGTQRFRLTVRATADIPYLLLHLVPFEILGASSVGRSGAVNAAAAQATAERESATVSLVLDVSRSMACPSRGDCSCLTPERTDSCEDVAERMGVPTKIELLKSAVTTFVEQFDSGIDRISMVPFNIVGTTDNNYATGGKAVRFLPEDGESDVARQGFQRDRFQSALANFQAVSSTNVCDAFMQSYEEGRRVGLLHPDDPARNEELAVVYFSDGAPTAGRFLFSAPRELPAHGGDMGEYDYLHYSVQWVEADGSAGGSGYRSWVGPSPLVRSGSIPIDRVTLSPVTDGVPECSSTDGEAPSDRLRFDAVFDRCIATMAAHHPYETTATYGNNYGVDTPFRDGWREQYYNCAIEMADFYRNQKATVFVIGLGQPSTVFTEPYQDIDETFLRKDVFLSRVANDYTAAYRVPRHFGGPVHPEFSYHNYRTYAELQADHRSAEGLFIPVEESEELEEAFRNAATRILLRLVR
ncbi:MAG: VWA domain-containing protein [Bdellovibrionales bacterium]|nr:VWA domain-containing protein [Bdellovibrionales bacterium]